MCEERAKVRCVQCELLQWADRANCRRCRQALPAPIVNVVERVVIQQDSECLENLQQASKLICATAERLEESPAREQLPVRLNSLPAFEAFPMLDQVERALILAAYRKSNRKPVEAARLLGIGKTTFYRKLRAIRQAAAQRSPGDLEATRHNSLAFAAFKTDELATATRHPIGF